MPFIESPNPDFKGNPGQLPSKETNYSHPVDTERGATSLGGGAQIANTRTGIPMAFQVTSPFNRRSVLMPHALVLHVNPATLSETHNQKIERLQTRGGFVEQHWGHELVELSAEGSTGAFMHVKTGLTSVLRQRTIAWDRYRDLHDLYLNNGSVHDPFGNIVLQGHIMLMYDRGVYLGTFRTFSVEETDEMPFAFALSWTFKVEHTLTHVADNSFTAPSSSAPSFQLANVPVGASGGVAGSGQNATGTPAPAPVPLGGSPPVPAAPVEAPAAPPPVEAPGRIIPP